MDKLIIYIEPEVAALPTSIVIYAIKSSLKINRYNLESKTVDDLVDSGQLKYEHEFVDFNKINYYGWEESISPAVNLLLEQFLYNTKLKPTTLLRTPNCPINPFHNIESTGLEDDRHMWIGRSLTSIKRKWWSINVWHKILPIYNWDNNYGLVNNDHIFRVLENGASLETHYDYFLRSLPRLWINRIRKFDYDFMLYKNLILEPPAWWLRLYNTHSFVSELNINQLRLLNEMVANKKRQPSWERIYNDINTYLEI